jgi:hypothetical protein
VIEERERKALFRAISGFISEIFNSIAAKVDALDALIKSIPLPQKGDKGDPGEKGMQGEKGESIVGPKGDRGDPGESIVGPKGDKGDHGERGEKGDPGPAGPQGEKGISGESIVGPVGPAGSPGRDAMQIDLLPAIDLSKSYPRGTFARYDGGIIHSYRDTIPGEVFDKSGWEVAVRGWVDFTVDLGSDFRTFMIGTRGTGEETKQTLISLPVMLYRGVYAPGEYSCGDVVTWGGSAWHCQADKTISVPGKNADWKLMVKEGQRGKDGKDGDRGLQGLPGKDGRDLTQMGFDGGKY